MITPYYISPAIEEKIMLWEINFIVWLQSLGQEGSLLYVLNRIFTFFGEELVIAAVFCVFYWAFDKKTAVYLGLAACASCSLNCVIKNIVQRPRPWTASNQVKILKPVDGFSFPSGHSQNGAFLYFSFADYFKKKVFYVLATVMTILIMFSRNYLGAHYATDVLVGAVLGIFCAFVIPSFARKHEKLLAVLLLTVPLPFLIMPLFVDFFANTQGDIFAGYGMTVGMLIGLKIERKYVNFQNAKGLGQIICRSVIGLALLTGLYLGLKPLFALIASQGQAANWLKLVRYAIMFLFVVGIYPFSFRFTDRLFVKKENEKAE